jgi:cytochrome c-type biogenesis protein CcmE
MRRREVLRAARHNGCRMDPSHKRRVRLVVALTAAVLLAGALVWTSFGSAAQTRTPSELLATASAGQSYQLTGKVVPGYTTDGTVTNFRVRDRSGSASVPVRYAGELPDPFRGGREVIVDVRKQGGVFVGEKDTLVTKCPSKFSAAKPKSQS